MLCGVANFHSEIKGTPPSVLASQYAVVVDRLRNIIACNYADYGFEFESVSKINVRPRQLRNTGRASFNCQIRDTSVFQGTVGNCNAV